MLFCISIEAKNKESRLCQIEHFEIIYSEAFQLKDASEYMAQQ